MKQALLSEEPRQLDLFESNIEPMFYSFPVAGSDRAWMEWQAALTLEKERKAREHERWKVKMYSMRWSIGRFGYRAYKQGGSIVVERIPFRGKELQEKMQAHT